MGARRRRLAKLQASGSIQPYEKEFFRKDGSRVPVLIGGALFQEGGNEGVVFVLDLSEQKQAEDKIREQESELRQILDFTPQLIAVYGPNWERLYINRVALDYLGLTLDAWRQQRTFGAEDHHPDDSAQLEASMRRALSSDRVLNQRSGCAKQTAVTVGFLHASTRSATNRNRSFAGMWRLRILMNAES